MADESDIVSAGPFDRSSIKELFSVSLLTGSIGDTYVHNIRKLQFVFVHYVLLKFLQFVHIFISVEIADPHVE